MKFRRIRNSCIAFSLLMPVSIVMICSINGTPTQNILFIGAIITMWMIIFLDEITIHKLKEQLDSIR